MKQRQWLINFWHEITPLPTLLPVEDIPGLSVATGYLRRVMGLDDFAIVRPSRGRSCAAMVNSCPSCGAIEVEDVNSALIRSCADPCRVAVKGNAVDLCSIYTSAKLVE
jgi:hypothetical protein